MTLIADGLLLAAALAAIFYCGAMTRRLAELQRQSSVLTERLTNLDTTVLEVRTIIAEGRSLAEAERDSLGNLVQSAERLRTDLKKAAATLERDSTSDTDSTASTGRESGLERIKRLNRTPARSAS